MLKVPKLWAILQFKPNAHKLAEHNLNQQGFKTFLPFEEVSKYKNQKLISTHRPLFPGYMFVAIERENMPWQKINNTYGVSKLLTLSEKPYIIDDHVVSGIMANCDQDGVLLLQKQFSKDDSVRIISGPFDDFFAKVVSVDKNQRIWVLINIMGQATRTLVEAKKLKYAN
jgi:transcriptional antiterminator RfaH